jgi:hypothetical protein
MARARRAAGSGGVRLPGAYETLLRERCESETRPRPWVGYEGLGSWISAEAASAAHREYERACEQGAQDAAVLFEKRLKAGEPITVPKWMVGGHSLPAPKDVPLFRDRSVRSYRVFADDRIEVAERVDDV